MHHIPFAVILLTTVIATNAHTVIGQEEPWLIPVERYADGLSELPQESNRAGLLAIAPNGNWIAAAPANSDGAIRIYQRNATDGTLALEVQLGAPEFPNASSFCFAPDSNSLILCGSREIMVVALNGNRPEVSILQQVRSGELTVPSFRQLSQCYCTPDGRSFYAAEFRNQFLLCFERDVQSGKLSYVEALQDDSVAHTSAISPNVPLRMLEGARKMDGVGQIETIASAPDGKQILMGVAEKGRLSIFDRDSETGRLSLRTTIKQDPVRPNGVSGVRGIAFDSEGDCAVTASLTGGVSLFARRPENGVPTFVEVYWNDTRPPSERNDPNGRLPWYHPVLELENPSAVVFVPHHAAFIVASSHHHALHAFRCDSKLPKLTWAGRVKENDAGFSGLLKVQRLAISPDGNFLYAASANATVAVFQIKL